MLDRHIVKNAINILGKHTRYLYQHVEKFDLALWSVLWLPGGMRGGVDMLIMREPTHNLQTLQIVPNTEL